MAVPSSFPLNCESGRGEMGGERWEGRDGRGTRCHKFDMI